MTIQVKAIITESGEIKVDLPKDHPIGEVTITIEPSSVPINLQTFQDLETISRGQVIQRMMRTDVWHIYQNILNQCPIRKYQPTRHH